MREPEATERIEYLIDQVGLSDVIDRRVRTFSRGMRQRLGLADALIKRPSILILDEPTVNIDPEGVRELLTFVGDLRARRRHDRAVVVASAAPGRAGMRSDRHLRQRPARRAGHRRRAGRRTPRRLGVRARRRPRTVDRHASARPSARSRASTTSRPTAAGRCMINASRDVHADLIAAVAVERMHDRSLRATRRRPRRDLPPLLHREH